MTGEATTEATWSRTDYPKACPECGEATSVKRPGLTSLPRWLFVALVVVAGVTLLVRTYAEKKDPTTGALFLGVLVAVAVLHRQDGGSRFHRLGFGLCRSCGWMRSGQEDGPAVEGRRARALQTRRWLLGLLFLAWLYFNVLFCVAPDRARYGGWAMAIMWAGFAVIFSAGPFQAEQHPPRPREADHSPR